MNDREKEVYQAQLEAEKEVLKKLEKLYKSALDDIDEKVKILQSDELTQSKIYQAEYQKALRGQIAGIVEKLHGDEYTTIQQYLHDCYTDAFVGTMYDIHGQGIPLIIPIDQNAAVKAIQLDSKINEGLYKALGVDATALKKTIQTEVSRGIATSLGYAAIARNISNASKAPRARAMLIARTESHRITQASTFDAQKGAKKRGCDVLKQWDATMDGDTRPTHRQLDGQLREIDKPFEIGNRKAMFPGDFGDPAEDCNCRCVSNTRVKWDLDEDELETLKERAAFFGLDKTAELEEFKERYLSANKMAAAVENDNDWSSAKPRTVTKEDRRKAVEYAEKRNINLVDMKSFDGDIKLLESGIDALSDIQKTLGLQQKITVGFSHSLPDSDFASTRGSHITFNAKAFRNRAVTEENIANGQMFASVTVEDMCVHEYGHIFSTAKGNKGLEIARKAYYNVYGEEIGTDELLEFLDSDVSSYSIFFDPEQGKSQRFHQKRYKEIISEVLAKNNSDPSGFTEEFVDLLKGL